VTLHPKVHGGILADLDDPDHRATSRTTASTPIALVVVNLYPFASDPGIELIDVGGPAMVRAAAKNHAHVGVVVDPADYEPVLDELRQRRRLCGGDRRAWPAAFARTARLRRRASSPGSTATPGGGGAGEPGRRARPRR
jgi:phosphoribosylaminoimidazolecarboxamide formyltransferase/IMP cyclohydrolase